MHIENYLSDKKTPILNYHINEKVQNNNKKRFINKKY